MGARNAFLHNIDLLSDVNTARPVTHAGHVRRGRFGRSRSGHTEVTLQSELHI